LPVLLETNVVQQDLAMSVLDESSLRKGKLGFQRGIRQRVSTPWERRQMSKEQKWGYILNRGLIRAVISSVKFRG
jgi:hypothetical protein